MNVSKQEALDLKQKMDQDSAALHLPVQDTKVAYVSTRQGWQVKFNIPGHRFGVSSEYAWQEWKERYQQDQFAVRKAGRA